MVPVHVRWMNRTDMPEVLWVEGQSFPTPWTEEDFLKVLRHQNVVGMVAERDERVVGYMIYELHKRSIGLVNLAVHPDWRRRGVGRQLLAKLAEKGGVRRPGLVAATRDGNLPAQLFFRACGWTARRVLPGYFEDTGETAYEFFYWVPAAAPAGA